MTEIHERLPITFEELVARIAEGLHDRDYRDHVPAGEAYYGQALAMLDPRPYHEAHRDPATWERVGDYLPPKGSTPPKGTDR